MPAYQRLFDPPSQDDLEYLPDPFGRLDMGGYVETPADIPDPGWDAARGDWMDGVPLGQIFGDGLFDLQSGVGAGQANRRGDVFKLQALLHREGVLDAAATEGPTGYWSGRDDYALRKFQKENGLAIDGYALPDGETISTIREFYRSPPGIRTMEKRSGDPEPELRPIGLGSGRPVKPTLLSGDRGTQQEAQVDTGTTGNLPAVSDVAVAETPLLYRW
ncbi:peptidoglycan-binding protein [Ferrovibrio sp.]|uniref:peptidoglycan-binding domain-containing protein n=1 Tax=Ferrovibrio sp. TaxID=1917215 RepID=UPI0035B2D192